MPPSEQERAHALQRALEGRLSRTEPSVQGLVAAELMATARELGAIESGDGLPSPTFVLGLEEQLRTDLRLGLANAPGSDHGGLGRASHRLRGAPRSRWLLVAAMLIGATLLATTWNAGPYHPLYEARLRLDSLRWSVVGMLGAGADGGAEFEQGRRLVEDARAVVERPTIDAARLQRILSGVPAMYSVGAERATESTDQWALMRARIEVQAAAAELDRLRAVAAPDERAALEQTRDLLSALLDPNRPGPVAVVVTAVPTDAPTGRPTQSAPPATVTATPTDMPTERTPTSPAATSTPVPASPTASATHTPTSPPPTRERPEPSETRRPVEPTGTPGAVWPSPTRDAWPSATPGQPGGTLPAPTAGATEQFKSPLPPQP